MDFLKSSDFFSSKLLKVTKITTEHHKWPKTDQNWILQLEVSPRSGLYRLVAPYVGKLKVPTESLSASFLREIYCFMGDLLI